MGLENLLSRAKNGLVGTALGLAMAVSPMYGCGGDECPDQCYENVCGTYDVAFNTVEEEPDDVLPPEKETGEFELDVLRVSENKIKTSVFEKRGYDYDPESGDIACQKWGIVGAYEATAEYEVCGNIRNGHLDMDATVDINYPKGYPYYPEGRTEHVKYHLDGTKKTE